MSAFSLMVSWGWVPHESHDSQQRVAHRAGATPVALDSAGRAIALGATLQSSTC